MLEFFLGGFGAGWFYLNRLDFALAQLLVTVVPCCAILCFTMIFVGTNADNNGDKLNAAVLCVRCVFVLASFALWLHGVIVIGTGKATDDNGVSVSDW